VFYPPYAFNTDKPKLISVPNIITFNQTFNLTYDVTRNVPITAVRLVAPSATTHSTNMNQRVVGLAILGNDSKKGVLTAQGPPEKNTAIPGADRTGCMF
jgi:Domain of unknown function (DUF1929)